MFTNGAKTNGTIITKMHQQMEVLGFLEKALSEFFAAVLGAAILTAAVLPVASGTTTGTTILVFGWFRFDFRLSTVLY